MLHHRFRELFEVATPAAAMSGGAFIPCPCPMFGAVSMQQQQVIQDVYRLAAERTRVQMAPARRPFRIPEFSLN